jgi:two-component system, OmpR family, response regulator
MKWMLLSNTDVTFPRLTSVVPISCRAAAEAKVTARSARRVLVIEDDAETVEQIADCLCRSGYYVDVATDDEEGLARAITMSYVVVTVDRLLPRLDGIEVIRRLRDHGVGTPALILDALSEVDERVRGLRAGGDDYLVKPFASQEMLARVDRARPPQRRRG